MPLHYAKESHYCWYYFKGWLHAINHYGLDNFDFLFIASAKSRSDLHALEYQLIKQYDSVINGYNQTRGGAAGESVGSEVVVEGQTFISINSAARHYGVEEYSVHQRTKRYGWSLEQALEIIPPPETPRVGKEVVVDKQHFSSLNSACRAYKINEAAVRSRLNIGWSIRQAFEIDPPPIRGRNVGSPVFINGKRFKSISCAANHYDLNPSTVSRKIRKGLSPEQAVGLEKYQEPSIKGTAVKVNNVNYPSIASASRSYNKNPRAVWSRLKSGMTIEQALDLDESPPRSNDKNGTEITVAGVTYASITKAAKAHNISRRKITKRLKLFWSIDQAFDLAPSPSKKSNNSSQVKVDGILFDSIRDACGNYNITQSTVYKRVKKKGWSLEDAIKTPSRKKTSK